MICSSAMEFKMVDHCRIEFADGRKPVEHGLVRINGETAQLAEYATQTTTLSDGSEAQEETGRTDTVESIEQAEIREGTKGKFAITGFARSRKNTADEEVPFTVTVIPDLRLCTTCG